MLVQVPNLDDGCPVWKQVVGFLQTSVTSKITKCNCSAAAVLYTKKCTLDVHNLMPYDVTLCIGLALYSVGVLALVTLLQKTWQVPSRQALLQKFLLSYLIFPSMHCSGKFT